MKGLMLLIALLAIIYLAQAAVAQGTFDIRQSCEDLTIHPNTGILSGQCQADKDPALTYVDLNKCLAWGPHTDPGHLSNTKRQGPVNALTPAENGNFSEHCHPCYFIPRDEEGQTAAHMMCNCKSEGSDFNIEYPFDLTDIVNVNNDGCLQCMGAGGVCAPEVRLDSPEGVDPGDLDGDSPSALQGMLDWFKVRALVDRMPCEEQITESPSRILPVTWKNTTYHTCKDDHGLCCFQNRGVGCSSSFEAFHLIESHKYWYRMQYTFDFSNWEIDELGSVYQFCKNAGQCKDETTLDDPSGVPACNRTDTDNPLKPFEKFVYEDADVKLYKST